MFAKHLALIAGLYLVTWGLAVAIFGMDYGRLEVGIGVVAGGGVAIATAGRSGEIIS